MVLKRVADPPANPEPTQPEDIDLWCASLKNLSDYVGQSPFPDFGKSFARIDAISIDIPDDPQHFGLDATKGIFRHISDARQLIGRERTRAIYTLSRWKVVERAWELRIKEDRINKSRLPEYESCKNAEQRSAFLESSVDMLWVEATLKIDSAVKMCQDFVEICRVKGVAVESMHTCLSRQIAIVELQLGAHHKFIPVENEED